MNIDYFKFSVPFSQLKKKADSLKITEEKFKERAMLFLSKEEASNFTRSVFHPTKEDIEDGINHLYFSTMRTFSSMMWKQNYIFKFLMTFRTYNDFPIFHNIHF